MTLSLTLPGITAEGNGATFTFSYPFEIPAAADAVITFTDPSGVQTVLPPTQYAISGVGLPTGGTVTYPLTGPAIASGSLFTIQRILPLIQTTAITYDGPVFASIETELDYLTMVAQQLNYTLSRTIQLNVADINPAPQLPPAAQRAGGFLTFDSNGNPTITQELSGNVTVSAPLIPFLNAASLSDATNILQYTDPLPNSIARSLGARIADTVSVKDFGAVGDGVTDDTAAFQKAMANMGMAELLVPAGSYVLSNTVSIGPGQFITGSGPAATNFIVTHAFNDIFVISGTSLLQGGGITGFSMSSTVTRTGGHYILDNSSLTSIIDNFTMTGAFIAIELTGIGTHVTRGQIRENVNRGILVSAGNDDFISNIIMDNSVTPQPVAGIEITNASSIFVSSFDSIRQGTGVLIGPGTGQTSNWCTFTDVLCDTCSGAAWQIQCAGTGAVNGVAMENCWGSSSDYGIYIDALAGTIDSIHVTNFRALGNILDGVHLNSVKNYFQIGGVVSGNGAGAPLAAGFGVSISQPVMGATFSGIRIGPSASLVETQIAGIILATGVDHVTITGCDLSTTQPIAIEYSGSAGPNVIIRNNQGFRNEAHAEAVMSQGTSSVSVPHTLAIAPAPADIIILPTTNPAASGVTTWWVSAVGATTFIISANTNTTNDLFFTWFVAVKSAGIP